MATFIELRNRRVVLEKQLEILTHKPNGMPRKRFFCPRAFGLVKEKLDEYRAICERIRDGESKLLLSNKAQ